MVMLWFCGCNEKGNGPKPVEHYLFAQVNKMDWRVKESMIGAARAQLHYDESFKFHHLTISASKDSVMADGNKYTMNINIRHTASSGRFEFAENPLPGYSVSGNLVITRPDGETHIRGASIDGYIDISELTWHDLKGTLAFTAVTAKSTSYGGYPGGDTIRFENGRFHVALVGGRDDRWQWPK